MKLQSCASCGSMAPENAVTCKFCGGAIDPFEGEAPPETAEGLPEGTAPAPTELEAPASQPDDLSGHQPGDDDPTDEPIPPPGTEPPSPWSRAGAFSGASASAARQIPTAPTPPRPPGTPTGTPATESPTERHSTDMSGSAPAADRTTLPPSTATPTGAVSTDRRARARTSAPERVVNGVVRTLLVVLGVIVAGVVLLLIAGQFGAGPIGKQREAMAGRGDWITYSDPDGTFTVQLPTEPTVNNRQTDFGAPWRSVKSRAGLSEFEVSTIDYKSGLPGVYALDWLDRQPAFFAQGNGGTLKQSKRISVQGNPGIEYSIEGADGWSSRGAMVIIGRRAYLFEVVARGDSPDGLQRMLQTFTPLSPGS